MQSFDERQMGTCPLSAYLYQSVVIVLPSLSRIYKINWFVNQTGKYCKQASNLQTNCLEHAWQNLSVASLGL